MPYYYEKGGFFVSGLTSGLTTINCKKMTFPAQGRTLRTGGYPNLLIAGKIAANDY